MNINEIVLLVAIFFSLFLSMFYLSYLFLTEKSPRRNVTLSQYPRVTIAIPAYNEGSSLRKTVESVLSLHYPPDKLEVVVIDDGSCDDTGTLADDLATRYGVRVIHQENQGKAAALNKALELSSGEYFGCVDADSTVDRNALLFLMERFEHEEASACISAIKVADASSGLEHLQRFEYLVSVMMRSIYSSLDFLSVTPGVLSVYVKADLVEVGGFDTNTLTEDFEIAMRLKSYGKRILLSSESITYTTVPSTFKELRTQRVRWYRGFISTMLEHRKMVMSRRYKTFGLFYLPTSLLSVLFIFVLFPFMIYNVTSQIIELIIRSSIVDSYVLLLFQGDFSWHAFILMQNYAIIIPLIVAISFGVYLIYRAYRFMHEPLKRPISLLGYLFLFPLFIYLFWTASVYEELRRAKRQW
jgi:poly-beta-1,6-N-acetyl-D-glucosamine synthase